MKRIFVALLALGSLWMASCTKSDNLGGNPIIKPDTGVVTTLSYGSKVMLLDSATQVTKKVGDLTLGINKAGSKTIDFKLYDENGNVIRTFASISSTTKQTTLPFDLPVERKTYYYWYKINPTGFTSTVNDAQELEKRYPIRWEYTYSFSGGNNIVLGVSSGTVTVIGNDTATRIANVTLIDGSSSVAQVTNANVTGNSYTFNVNGLLPNKVYTLEVRLGNATNANLYVLQANIRM